MASTTSAPTLRMSNEPVLIDVLNIDLSGTHFQQRKGVYAAIVGIAWLRTIVHPFHRYLWLSTWRVVRETTVAESDGLDPHVFLIGYTQMLMSPDPTIDLISIQKWLHAAHKMAGIGIFISRKELMM